MRTFTYCTLNYLLQRWKEQYFVNVGTDCGLTIAGFYYICFSCSDGSISGFYYDPNSRCFSLLSFSTWTWTNLLVLCMCLSYINYNFLSPVIFLLYPWIVFDMKLWTLCSPYQKLELKSTNDGRSGFSFSSYELQ